MKMNDNIYLWLLLLTADCCVLCVRMYKRNKCECIMYTSYAGTAARLRNGALALVVVVVTRITYTLIIIAIEFILILNMNIKYMRKYTIHKIKYIMIII